MTDDGQMVYTFGVITAISEAVAGFVGKMNSELDALDVTYKNLLAHGWTGATASQFNTASTNWHHYADQMATTLQTLSTKVATSGENMSAADNRSAGLF